jgi:hypothetical protein
VNLSQALCNLSPARLANDLGVSNEEGFLLNIRVRGMAAMAAAVMLGTFGLVSPAAAAGQGNSPTLSAFAFAQATVDVTGAPGTDTMTWTVTDKSKNASTIWGDITIRQQGARAGTYVGPAYDVTFGTSWDGTIKVLASSGNAASSSYTYAWPVPRYSATATAKWIVTQVSIRDDQGNTRTTGTPKHGSFTATDLVDSTAPAYESLGIGYPAPDTVYVGGGAKPVDIEFFVTDEESGLAGGSIVFSGPGGASITTPFQIFIQDGLPTCGSDEGGDYDVLCDVDFTFPAGATAGDWTLTALNLTDNVGNTGRYTTDLPLVTVHVTSDADIQASNFALTPSQANNWTSSAPLTLTMDITRATGGIATVNLQGTCAQMSTTPTDLGGGSISVPLLLGYRSRSCEVTGAELIDGAGHESVYGTPYGAPALDLVAKQVPDTTPPVAISAYLNQTTFTQGGGLSVVAHATVHSQVGVVEMEAYIYNADGSAANAGAYGGVPQTTDGTVSMGVRIDSLPPGTYTVGFFLDDAGGLESHYDFPGDPLPSWGALQFTVTAA